MFSFCICTAHQKQQPVPPLGLCHLGENPTTAPRQPAGALWSLEEKSDGAVSRISKLLLFHLLEIAGHAAQLIGTHRYAYPCKIPKHSGRIFHGLPLLSSLWYIFYPPRLKIQLFHFLWYVSWLFPLSAEEQIKPPITNSKLQSPSAALLPTLTLVMNSLDFTIASAWGPNGATPNKCFMDWCGFRSRLFGNGGWLAITPCMLGDPLNALWYDRMCVQELGGTDTGILGDLWAFRQLDLYHCLIWS